MQRAARIDQAAQVKLSRLELQLDFIDLDFVEPQLALDWKWLFEHAAVAQEPGLGLGGDLDTSRRFVGRHHRPDVVELDDTERYAPRLTDPRQRGADE